MSKNPKSFESAFNTYSVTAVIGEGGSGRVFSVTDIDGNNFALKCLFPDRITAERRKRFKNEIGFCEKNRHKNIIPVIDDGFIIWDDTKCLFYVMPYYQGTLRSLIEKTIEQQKILLLYSQLLDGVEAAHISGVWHRDLKPENALYNPENNILVVADFGIAHFEEDIIATEVVTKPASKMANIRYSAPEQRKKGTEVDQRADIYALGLLLNEMFTGDVPQGAGYKTISSISPEYAYLDGLVERMIQQDPSARPSSIDEIKKELIGRKNQFIARQRLDAKRGEVVSSAEPDKVAPLKVNSLDYQNGNLIFKLNRKPEVGVIQWFKNPKGSYGQLIGYGPEAFVFYGDEAKISNVRENSVQDIVNFFKQYLDIATSQYRAFLDEEADKKNREMKERLEREIAEAEKRERILKNIKI
jgi:serine/threonine protein kinase